MSNPSLPRQASGQPDEGACHPSHRDWTELTEHLISRFDTLPDTTVITEVARARSSIDGFSLTGTDELATAEIMARHALVVLVERERILAEEIAELDAELDDGDEVLG